jgi:hypothetical protein
MTWLAGALRRLLPAWLLCAACAASAAPPMTGFGVMVHYLPDKQTIADVARFDAEALAASLARMRASYLILTLGQNNGQFIAPNAALELLCPGSIENRPPRDLPMEIARALQRRGIGLVLYLPFRAPQGDAYLMDCLGDVSEQKPPPARFIAGWTAVVREWSEHYGALAKGWWFDGVYNTKGMSAEDWNGLCAAARTGAPKRWLAFNSGEGPQRFSAKAAPCQNLMAGELLQPPAPSVPFHHPRIGPGVPRAHAARRVVGPDHCAALHGRPGARLDRRCESARRAVHARPAAGLGLPLSTHAHRAGAQRHRAPALSADPRPTPSFFHSP